MPNPGETQAQPGAARRSRAWLATRRAQLRFEDVDDTGLYRATAFAERNDQAAVFLGRWPTSARNLRSSYGADDGVVLDFSAKSVRAAFEAIARRMATVKTTPDDELPEWMKTSDQYPLGIYEES